MRLTEGELLSWKIVAEVLADEDPVEADFLLEIVETSIEKPHATGNQPGGFDIGSVSLQATAIYGAASAIIVTMAPKLFDAALDVTKEVLKKRLSAPSPATKPAVALAREEANKYALSLAELSRLQEAIRAAGGSQHLSPTTIDRLSSAIVAHLVEAQLKASHDAAEAP